MKLPILNLDGSYPISDSYHLGNKAGTVRFTDEGDSLSLPMLQRVEGDLVHRSKLVEASVNLIIDFINKSPVLAGFDDSPFLRIDGSRSLTRAIECGEEPSRPKHLTTKSYVDSKISAANLSVTELANDLDAFKDSQAKAFKSGWQLYTWQAGRNTVVTLPITGTPSIDSIESITLLEKLDVAVPTSSSPNPPPVYKIRELSRGLKGMAIDDYWFDEDTNTVKVLVPNVMSYEVYPGSGNSDLQTPRSRWLKAVITA